MSAVTYIHKTALPAALSLLPEKMDTPEARAMLLAIGLQESRFMHRRQEYGGPGHGFFQFERNGGVRGVLTHASSRGHILPILDAMAYVSLDECYESIVDNDILACIFARLLLWTHPKPLPARSASDLAWHYYLSTWRPGKPRRESWDDFCEQAWTLVD